MFRFLPEGWRAPYLWLAFFVVPGLGFVLTGVPGSTAATVAKWMLALSVVHHSLFLILAGLEGLN